MSNYQSALRRLEWATSTVKRKFHRKVCLIVWCVEDVQMVCKEHGYRINIYDAEEILDIVENKHDACYGVNWDTIWAFAEEYIQQNKRNSETK